MYLEQYTIPQLQKKKRVSAEITRKLSPNTDDLLFIIVKLITTEWDLNIT